MSTRRIRDAGSGLRPRNWRVRRRLVALVLVPTVATVLLGGVQALTSIRAAGDYRRVNDLARLSGHVGTLTHELAEERDRTAWFIALGRPERGLKDVQAQMALVDGVVGRVRDSGALLGKAVRGRTQDEVETAITHLNDLRPLRRQALESTLLPDAAIAAYTLVIADLLSLHDELGKGSADDVLFGQALTLDALARAKEALSFQRALLTVVLVAGRFEQEQMERFLGALSTERNERGTFAAEAGSRERRAFDETVNGPTADRAEFLRELVLLRAASGASLRGLDLAKKDDAKEWYDAATVTIDTMREVEERHAKDIVVRSEELGDIEQGHALMVTVAVAALLVLVLVITVGVARSLVGPLRRLRREALAVAGERLPAYVQRVRDSHEGEIVADVPPIGGLSNDEIGEVARAFDEVHREAVRLAGDEAKLRGTVNAMFVNLSRRSQTLVERQLTLVERLERGERDDQRLADLFRLDHLATRMRRNSENLLVLAGQEVARRWRHPVELMDVVRASLSEVENYDRVTNRVQTEVAVAGPAVSDVVHLLAELVENALSFSQTNTRVTVSSNRIEGGGVMVSVSDEGIGMTADELSQVNLRLAGPWAADASVARHMGLFVVGRLALKHGIRVQLRPQDAGLTAMVLLPDSLLVMPAAVPRQTGYPGSSAALPAGVETFPPAGVKAPPPRVPLLAAPLPAQAPEMSVWSPPAVRSRTRGESPADGTGPPTGPLFGPLSGPLSGEAAAPPNRGDDFLPIFASVESGWFRTAAEGREKARPAPEEYRAEPEPWSSPGDGGWQAAQAASAPAHGGTTEAGLPRRTPKANLVPGSVTPLAPVPQGAPISAERRRDRLSSFQRGVRRARNELPNRER